MSRIGRRVLQIPQGVKVHQEQNFLNVTGPKGSVKILLNKSDQLQVVCENDKILIKRSGDEKKLRMMHGTLNALVANAIQGVVQPWVVKLNLVGVGYRASTAGKEVTLGLGYSHPVKIVIPEGIKVECPSQTEIVLSATDKSQVTQFASEIRSWRPPEPYKGKGVLYDGEKVIRKVGKTAESSKK